MGLAPNTLYYGDCLDWLPRFPFESVDLIHLDPPFNSNQSYNLLFGNGSPKGNGGRSAQVRVFDDTWRWDEVAAQRVERISRAAAHRAVVGLRILIGEGGMLAYLSYMAERLAEMPMLPALADPYTGKPVQGSLQISGGSHGGRTGREGEAAGLVGDHEGHDAGEGGVGVAPPGQPEAAERPEVERSDQYRM